MDWQAAQHQDELLRMERSIELLDASAVRPLTEAERIEIAAEIGLGRYYQNINHTRT